mgnify:CR=1 FL=1
MTAEIVVANPLGVALAADSAATIEHAHGQKVYNSANKLFRLSHAQPVGLMIYNAAAISGVPWETLIKEYRQKYGDYRFGTLQEHAEDFLAFVEEHSHLPSSTLDEFYSELGGIALHAKQLLIDWAAETFKVSSAEIEARQASKRLLEILEDCKSQFQRCPLFESAKPHWRFGEIKSARFKRVVSDIAGSVFTDDLVSSAVVRTLVEIAHEMAIRHTPSSGFTGIVFAGFGATDLFPTLVDVHVRSRVGEFLRLRRRSSSQLSRNHNAVIAPFAQDDIVRHWMEGVHPRYRDEASARIKRMVSSLSDVVVSELANSSFAQASAFRAALEKAGQSLLDHAERDMQEWQQNQMTQPILDAVQYLPIDELAGLAESLVKTTALRRRISMDIETVGGAVDVAVITKGDGFIWMNRKHYFDRNMNPHFFERSSCGRE